MLIKFYTRSNGLDIQKLLTTNESCAVAALRDADFNTEIIIDTEEYSVNGSGSNYISTFHIAKKIIPRPRAVLSNL